MKRLLWFAVVFILSISVGYWVLKKEGPLPILNPSDINPELVDQSLRAKRQNHRVADFRLINQMGDTITKKDFEGKIYAADFFFTRCATICPIMTMQFSKLQEAFKDEDRVKFISHSVTPDIDSVEVLYNYSIKYDAVPGKWHLVTGDKKHIYELARKSYFTVLDEGDGGDQDFIHTENVALVDTKGRLRGFYDGTDDADMERLRQDMNRLLEEE